MTTGVSYLKAKNVVNRPVWIVVLLAGAAAPCALRVFRREREAERYARGECVRRGLPFRAPCKTCEDEE